LKNSVVEMIKFLAFVNLLLSPLTAAFSDSAGLGVYFENENQDTALLKLDYATYRATYNSTYDVSFKALWSMFICFHRRLIPFRFTSSRTSALQHRPLET
jgi:hypothetical protein